jgi:hypothetical protein
MKGEYDLPLAVKIDGKEFSIREQCDYRIVLRCINALNDLDLDEEQRVQCALIIFYEDYDQIQDIQTAINEMFRIISYDDTGDGDRQKPVLMDWEKDFRQIAPPVSRILGYDVRSPGKYTHWWTFVGGYMEIGECTFSTIVSIRSKKQKGQKLEKWEEAFYRENRSQINLPQKLTKEEEEFLALFE